MTTATLFCLALAPLYAAIAKVESDRGASSENVYQIRQVYVEDVNRLQKGKSAAKFASEDVKSRDASERMMLAYWAHWGIHYKRKSGKPVTYEVLARIHNGGPLGWKKSETVAYWNRVAAVLATQTEEDVNAWATGRGK